ncbi:MAG: hypothetical protein AAB624_00130 [Patescibacteria group bacterium]
MNAYRFILVKFYKLGFRKTAVRIAGFCLRFKNEFVFFTAHDFVQDYGRRAFPACTYEYCSEHLDPRHPHIECQFIMDAMHDEIDAAWALYNADLAARAACSDFIEAKQREIDAEWELRLAETTAIAKSEIADFFGEGWTPFNPDLDDQFGILFDTEGDPMDVCGYRRDKCSADDHSECINGPYEGHWADHGYKPRHKYWPEPRWLDDNGDDAFPPLHLNIRTNRKARQARCIRW